VDLSSGPAIRLKFLRGLSNHHGSVKVRPIGDANRANLQAKRLHDIVRLGIEADSGSWMPPSKQDKSSLADGADKVGCHSDGVQVKRSGAAGNYDQISGPSGSCRIGLGERWGVDQGQRRSRFLRAI
jgi:hypothetical protein